MKICILGDQIHCDQAKANNLPCMTADDLKKLNKDKKLIKKLGKCNNYKVFGTTIFNFIVVLKQMFKYLQMKSKFLIFE